jgi:acetylglutamate kinase
VKPIVVKIGGSLMESGDALRNVARALAPLWSGGLPLVLVHGGGRDINRNLQWLGEEPQFKDGIRVTSEDALLIVEMTLSGTVNKRLVSLLQHEGARSCGISGVDGSTLICRPLDPELGRVGTVSQVRPALVEALLKDRFLPVMSPVSADTTGAHYNVNADDAASALAIALKAERLVYVSDVPGVMDAQKHIVPRLNREAANALIQSGVIAGGMIPKVRSCLSAVEAGVGEVHICGFATAEGLEAQISGSVNSGTIVGV